MIQSKEKTEIHIFGCTVCISGELAPQRLTVKCVNEVKPSLERASTDIQNLSQAKLLSMNNSVHSLVATTKKKLGQANVVSHCLLLKLRILFRVMLISSSVITLILLNAPNCIRFDEIKKE